MYIVFRHFTEYEQSVENEKNKIWVAWFHAILFGFFIINTSINSHIEKMKPTQKQTSKQTKPIYTLFWYIKAAQLPKNVFDIF